MCKSIYSIFQCRSHVYEAVSYFSTDLMYTKQFLKSCIEGLSENNTHPSENNILSLAKGSVLPVCSLRIQRTQRLQQYQEPFGEHVYFCSKAHAHFVTIQTGRVIQAFLVYYVETSLATFWRTDWISGPWLRHCYKSLKKKNHQQHLEHFYLITKIGEITPWCVLSSCPGLSNVKLAITIGGAITCQGAVMENFVGSYFFQSLSFFSVLHLVLVIGFPWLSLDIACIWPKSNAGYQFHICCGVVQESVILASKLYKSWFLISCKLNLNFNLYNGKTCEYDQA